MGGRGRIDSSQRDVAGKGVLHLKGPSEILKGTNTMEDDLFKTWDTEDNKILMTNIDGS